MPQAYKQIAFTQRFAQHKYTHIVLCIHVITIKKRPVQKFRRRIIFPTHPPFSPRLYYQSSMKEMEVCILYLLSTKIMRKYKVHVCFYFNVRNFKNSELYHFYRYSRDSQTMFASKQFNFFDNLSLMIRCIQFVTLSLLFI